MTAARSNSNEEMITSRFSHIGQVDFPKFSGTRAMMVPFLLEDLSTIPLAGYRKTVAQMLQDSSAHGTAYLTIDEQELVEGRSLRRPGLHVDGKDASCGWGGGSPWASRGMILASSVAGCRAWDTVVEGQIGDEGDCEHLRDQLGPGSVLRAGQSYWASPHCIHESLPSQVSTNRTMVRISMPSEAPWYDGYTENSYGISPNGEVLPRRSFMDT